MSTQTVVLVGGNGFLGGWLAAGLGERGLRVVVPCRGRPGEKWAKAVPAVEFVQADVHAPGVLASLLPGADAVINLVGILQDRDDRLPFGEGFRSAHVELPQKIVEAMRGAGCRRLLHVSALRAADDAPSAYLRSKAAGEARLRAAGDLDVTVFRPSVIFGANDAFLNLFAQLLRFLPVLPLRALVGYVASVLGRPRLVLPLPAPLAYLQARLMAFLPNPPMSVDNLRSMELDSVTTGRHDYPGWVPTALESVAPAYLGRGH